MGGGDRDEREAGHEDEGELAGHLELKQRAAVISMYNQIQYLA